MTVRSERRIRTTQQQLPFMHDPRFRDFFGDRFGEGHASRRSRDRAGSGSGVIVNAMATS